jgi:hypothetical protein
MNCISSKLTVVVACKRGPFRDSETPQFRAASFPLTEGYVSHQQR